MDALKSTFKKHLATPSKHSKDVKEAIDKKRVERKKNNHEMVVEQLKAIRKGANMEAIVSTLLMGISFSAISQQQENKSWWAILNSSTYAKQLFYFFNGASFIMAFLALIIFAWLASWMKWKPIMEHTNHQLHNKLLFGKKLRFLLRSCFWTSLAFTFLGLACLLLVFLQQTIGYPKRLYLFISDYLISPLINFFNKIVSIIHSPPCATLEILIIILKNLSNYIMLLALGILSWLFYIMLGLHQHPYGSSKSQGNTSSNDSILPPSETTS